MTNPHTPNMGPESDKAKTDKSAPGTDSSLSLGSFVSRQDWLKHQPAFQIRKSEFEHEKEAIAPNELKYFVDDFLESTKKLEEEKELPQNLKEDMEKSRQVLEQANDPDDCVLHALHLARAYQHLRYIEEAQKATLLALGIDPDNVLAIELFKELERMHPQDITIASQRPTSAILSKSNLRMRIQALSTGKVIVLGDLLVDETLEGKPERISREAPVLILEHVDTELSLGGAANTAGNVAALGGSCHAIGVVGQDEYAKKLAGLFDKYGITHSLVVDPLRPTTVKTRIISKAHRLKQQLLRLDRISHEHISADIEVQIIGKLQKVVSDYSAVIMSDYRGGVMTDAIIKTVRKLCETDKTMLIVDAQDHFERFQNVTLITPNQPDTEKACGFEINSRETLKEAGEHLKLLTGAQAVLVTRGADGMALFERGEDVFEIGAFNCSEVFDVTGAGDTVCATMSLALVSGSTFVEAMALGNLAASIVVKKPGTVTTTQTEMLEALEDLDLPE